MRQPNLLFLNGTHFFAKGRIEHHIMPSLLLQHEYGGNGFDLIGLTEVKVEDAVFMKHSTSKMHVRIPTAVNFPSPLTLFH